MSTPQIDDGGPAFPGTEGVAGYGNSAPVTLPNGEIGWANFSQGMTLRDWFAGMALAHPYTQGDDANMRCDKAAHWAYQLADAMIAERGREA